VAFPLVSPTVFTNNASPATFTATGGAVNFSAGGAQTITNSNTTTAVTFNNLNISVSGTKTLAGPGKFNIGSTGIVTLSTSSSTIFNPGTALLTLNSDASGSAAIATLPSGTSITAAATVNVQRFVTGGAGMRGYRLLSSPVFTSTVSPNNVYSINYIANSSFITGTTVTTGGGPGIDKAGNPTLYLFRENLTPSQASFTSGNFRGVGNMGSPGTLTNINYTIDGDLSNPYNIPVGNGFLFFFRGDRSAASITAETMTLYVPTNTTLSTTGQLNQGTITVHDWYTPASGTLGWTNTTTPAPGNGTVQGYNLVGNPYASSISWTAVYGASSGVGVAAYEFNPVSNQYGAYTEGSGSGTGGFGDVIGSGQGFFAIASGPGAILNFTEATKVATSQPSTLLFAARPQLAAASTQQYMHLKMIKDSVNYDDVIIGFKTGASSKYSINEDALHLTGNAPPETLTALSSDSIGLSIDYLPLPTGQTIVGLNVNATASGRFQFSRTELVGIPAFYEIWLKDNLLKDSLDLRANTTYTFDIDKTNPASFGANRFQIVFRQNAALGVHLLNFTAAKTTSLTQVQVYWAVENEANYTTFNVQRSTDNGKTFQTLGTLQSDGSGNYTFTDKSPVLVGQDKYRLQLTDVNNQITYSGIIAIQYSDLSNKTPESKYLHSHLFI